MAEYTGLSPEQVEKYKTNGYLVIEGFFSLDEVEEMKQEMHNIVEEVNLDEHPVVKSLNDADEVKNIRAKGYSNKVIKLRGEYFLTSGDKIRFFLEKGAVDENEADFAISKLVGSYWLPSELIKEKESSINKVGHGLHALNPVFKKVTFSKRIQAIAKSTGFKHPVVPQSMYIFKPAGIGAENNPHRDSAFVYTEPPSAMSYWIPLEDCSLENGCLHFVPGSQNDGIKRRFIRNPEAGSTDTMFTGPEEEFDEKDFIPALTKKGSLVLIHGSVLHRSFANKSEKSRHAYTFRIVEQENTEYSKQNWLQETQEHLFPALYVE